MKNTIRLTATALLLVGGIVGCNTASNVDNTLTQGESDALEATLKAVSSLTLATNAGQAATDTDIPLAKVIETTCPTLTAVLDISSTGTLQLGIDFGSNGSCTPAWGGELPCSGSASAGVNVLQGTASVEFDELTCGDESLDGEAGLEFDWSGLVATLSGQWDLTLDSDGEQFGTDGTGDCKYELAGTTIESFEGTISSPEGSWNLKVDEELLVSQLQYGNLVPYAGQATVSGTDIRSLAVKFSTESPTGKIQVSIAGAPFFEVDVTDWL